MNNVFSFRDQLISEYSSFSRSFSRIAAQDIQDEVERQYADGRYWPEPLVQINPNYQRKSTVQQLVAEGVLHRACAELFQVGKAEEQPQPLHLYAHQLQALAKGQGKQSYVVTTSTGSGKSLSFFIPVIDRILKAKEQEKAACTRAIVIYPMNALANSQLEELDKFLHGYPAGEQPFTVARYTGQESKVERDAIAGNPPDILLTNFMMLELILTRFDEMDRRVADHCHGLEFLILDELHTYRGRQGADVALLVRRLRERLQAEELVCIGTSATMSSTGSLADRNRTVAEVASKLFGTPISEQDIIGETLERVTDPLKDVAAVQSDLATAVARSQFSWGSFDVFRIDPLSIWVELNLGIELFDNEPPRRAKPMNIQTASEKLANDSGCTIDMARDGLQRFLVAAHEIKTPQGGPPFAFKLHQFISGPGKVLATLEAQGVRHISLDAQRFAPGCQNEGVQLYPVHFCRDCGQEYLPVWQSKRVSANYAPREIDDITAADNEDGFYGFLCPATSSLPYRGDIEDLPETWLDFSRDQPKIKQNYKKAVPYSVSVDVQGNEGHGESFWYIPGKFRFCLSCGQSHEAHGKDINRLASLSGEGRSSATTILTLTALRQLFDDTEPTSGQPDPRKLLGFTDNRQDAALQAGHFNDFVFLLTLRAGLIGALQNSNGELSEEQLSDAVFKALGFDRLDETTLVEYLRNVPPTPANYAQRSGRAGRSGQQALVITYCASLSPHDQWFFHHANEMVHGVVRAPTLDLANRDLVESHLQAVWLANAHIALDVSIAPMLDLEQPGKPLIKSYHDALNDPAVTQRAQTSAARVIAQLQQELAGSDWFSADYVQKVIERAPQAFSDALARLVRCHSHTNEHGRPDRQKPYGNAQRAPECPAPLRRCSPAICRAAQERQHPELGFLHLPLSGQSGFPAGLQLSAAALDGLDSCTRRCHREWQGRRRQHGQSSALPGPLRIRPTQSDLSPGSYVPRGARQT